MKEFCKSGRYILIALIMVAFTCKANGQTVMPEEFTKGSIKDQMVYLQDRTKTYENFRAIREDIFQKMKNNTLDSINRYKSSVNRLNSQNLALNRTIDSLRSTIASNQSDIQQVTEQKNSIRFLGMNINKTTYNSIIWTIIVLLIIALVLGYLVFKRNLVLIQNTKKDLKDLNHEFEAYRKSSREAREKMTMDHFLEMKRLKGQ